MGVLAAAIWLAPDAVIGLAGGHVSGLTEALVFTLVPVVVVFAVAQQASGFGDDSEVRALVGPALAGVVGAALLIPFEAPASAAGKIWLAALVVSVVASGLAAVSLNRRLQGVDLVAVAALTSGLIVCAGAAAFDRAAFAGLVADHRALLLEALLALGMDGPLLLLGLWLLREMLPVGAAARYPVVLLVTIVESYFLMHGSGGWIMAVGAVLMAGSAGWLLRASARLTPERGDARGTLGL